MVSVYIPCIDRCSWSVYTYLVLTGVDSDEDSIEKFLTKNKDRVSHGNNASVEDLRRIIPILVMYCFNLRSPSEKKGNSNMSS